MAYKILLFFLFLSSFAFADIRLPKLVSDGMVLQRNADLVIWGWAANGENIEMSFQEKTYHTKSSEAGRWEIPLSPLKAGGPFKIYFKGNNEITIQNVLVGEVWVCSGQSNMELPMRRVKPKYETEIAQANNPDIRQFMVPQKFDFITPQEDLDGGQWKSVTPENLLDFSAVGYFFAKEINQKFKVPVGLIHGSLGGSPAEAWMSEEALKLFPSHYREAMRFKNKSLIQDIEAQDKERINQWYVQAALKDEGYQKGHWSHVTTDVTRWDEMEVPGFWSETALGDIHGVVWFRKDFEVPQKMTGQKATLNLGAIVDADSVWINGHFIGATTYMYPPRWYEIPKEVLKIGKNTMVVRVVNERAKGGFVPDKPYEITVHMDHINLNGKWKFQLGARMPSLDLPTFIRWKPLGLYNAMLSPILKYRMKGVIWYQGESNVERAKEYRSLFPAMVQCWRHDWKQGDFPFLFVQLANYLEPASQPQESNWALLREAQSMCLSLPNTAMAVAIDLGEWNDIHPLNKEDVGRRLSLAAEHVAYGEKNIIYSGPTYHHQSIKDNKIVLSFEHAGSGMVARGRTLKGFSIAGSDKKFFWAEAKIEGDKIIVYSNHVAQPLAVRYAWADNPEGANLYNKEGLPASPFRTDNW